MFSHLPAELINTIFLDCLPDLPSFKTRDTPLLLTHVCQSWRSIALDTPKLWLHIAVPRWKDCPKGVSELARLWITRAKNAPLIVDIALFNQDEHTLTNTKENEGLGELLHTLFSILAPHRARIQSFWGTFPTTFIPDIGLPEMTNVERLFYYGTPNSEEMLRIPVNFDAEDPHRKLDLRPAKQRLRILSVADCAVDINSVMLQTQLTHLELFDLHRSSGICQETAFIILQKLPNLKKCVLELSRQERLEWNGQSNRMVLKGLELLFLIWTFPADISLLLYSVSAPNLIRLGLRGTPTVGPRSWTALYDFLRVSQAPLMRISLGNLEDIDVQLLECLGCCPLLIHLSLNHCVLPDELFRVLTYTDDAWDKQLLPRLEILNLVACSDLKVKHVAAFLMSRAKDVPHGFSRIREVEISNCFKIMVDDAPLLQQCGVEKLVLKIAGDYLV